jgi:hypothetical protein
MDVLNMTRGQLIAELEARNIDKDEYIHAVRKEDVIDQY